LDGVCLQVHERVDEGFDCELVGVVLGDLDESHDCWGNNTGVAGFVSGSEEFHCGFFDLEECWLFVVEETFEEIDTLINGFIETDVITTTDFMECGFLFTSGVEVGELVFNTVLFITVKSEDAFTLLFGCGTISEFVVGTVTCEFCVSDFSSTEFFLFVTVNGLLGSKSVVFSLFGVDLINQSIEEAIDVF